MLYFEDLVVDQRFELGSYKITKEEIIRFAKEFDPQPFHIDEEKAKSSIFGSLIASGWHTNSIYMKLFVKEMMSRAHGMGSPGLEELKWKKPVFPDDTLSGIFTIIEKKPFKGNLGLVRARNELMNQNGVLVLSFIGLMLFAKRPQ
ncbi:MAG TPA: MaoC family dehydratase [Leptospiraceae bacterium]|nr:MaoC family dehydratase [Leptospiraceae bacterium]HMW06697.1 MaoC family dehydratase [Leptospiraceae bacterium]HMX31947.1 MaoC family dehydratase [Leptospiraceae bacterium]HMY33618.1 MaoC family dehydratase [Leptospiraceae bacterium]HMZ64907.1 MaoC family dehydratase [Leptospiraceae bacterium]